MYHSRALDLMPSSSEGERPLSSTPGDSQSLQVDVWHACLKIDAAQYAECRAVLTCDEQARAERLHFEHDRRRFIAARGILRMLLAQYTGIHAACLRFEYGPYGKPALAPGQADGLQFNVSHSHERAVFAFCQGRAVGVDIERIRSDVDWRTIMRQFFSPCEIHVLQTMPPAAQLHAFFCCWTRKEAYLKARGDGLAAPLDSFAVSVDPEEAALLNVADDLSQIRRWRLIPLDVGADYAATLAMECLFHERATLSVRLLRCGGAGRCEKELKRDYRNKKQ